MVIIKPYEKIMRIVNESGKIDESKRTIPRIDVVKLEILITPIDQFIYP